MSSLKPEQGLFIARTIANSINNDNLAIFIMSKCNSLFIRWLIPFVSEILRSEPNVVKLEGKFVVIGDIHGQFNDLLYILRATHQIEGLNLVFLGDYVDRGKNSIEVLILLLCLKVMHPKKFILLRGNHESIAMTQEHGFQNECNTKINKNIYEVFHECFFSFPLCAILNNCIMCIHGGISPHMSKINEIDEISRFCEVPEEGLLMDLLWSDPDPYICGFSPSVRGKTYMFGLDEVKKFLDNNGLKMIVRGHQVANEGYCYPFSPDQSLVTVFSASCYSSDYDNNAAYMSITDKGKINFVRIPLLRSQSRFSTNIPKR